MKVKQDIDTREDFFKTLQWLLAVVDRYADQFNFALVKVAYGGDNELGNAYGAEDASKQLVDAVDTFKQAFRKSDLVARNGADVWILFPYTPFSENIYQKIREVVDHADHDALQIVNRQITIFTSPFNHDEHLPRHSAVSTLEYLKKHEDRLAEHSFMLVRESTPA